MCGGVAKLEYGASVSEEEEEQRLAWPGLFRGSDECDYSGGEIAIQAVGGWRMATVQGSIEAVWQRESCVRACVKQSRRGARGGGVDGGDEGAGAEGDAKKTPRPRSFVHNQQGNTLERCSALKAGRDRQPKSVLRLDLRARCCRQSRCRTC